MEQSLTLPRPRDKRMFYLLPFIVAIHGIAFFTIWHYGLSSILIAYLLNIPIGLGVTLSLHRYFAHRAYKAGPRFQKVLLWLASMTGFRIIEWVSNHRVHHAHSDTALDVHSPLHGGIWWSHFQWAFYLFPIQEQRVQDLLANPTVVWFNRYWWLPVVCYFTFVVSLFGIMYGIPGILQGICIYFLMMVILWHLEGSVNSFTHLFGSRPYHTTDNSRNNPVIGILSFGEGWHNNHHHNATSARLGFRWYQFDFTYMVICILEKLHLVYDVKRPKS